MNPASAPDTTPPSTDGRGVATCVVHGRGRLNIVGSRELLELSATLQALAGNPDVRVLVLRGAGDGALIGGADIHEMQALERASAEAFIERLRSCCESLRQFPVPVIARLPGWCLGGGLEVAMSCDLRVAARDARFGMPEVKVGIPSVIHAALLPRLVGQGRARWMLLTGEPVDADTALAWGLVDQLADPQALDATVDHLAASLASMGPAVLRQQKRLLREWEDAPVDRSIARSVAEFGQAFETGEPQAYMRRFIDRPRSR